MADVTTTAGMNLVTDIMDETTSVPTDWHIGWGTGPGTATTGSTVLFTEASESRQIGTATQPSTNVNQWVATIVADGPKTISNAGVFSASSSGTLLMHSDFTGIAVDASDSIQFTFQLTWTAS